MAGILLPWRFLTQPQYPARFAVGHNPGACFIGSSPVELVGKQSRTESDQQGGVRPGGRVRVAGSADTSDTYPINIPSLTDFTVYLYASFVDTTTPFQYLLGLSGPGDTYLGIPAVHLDIGGRWGLLIGAGGANTFLTSNEILPQNQLTAMVVTRSGSTIKFFRDGVLHNIATNSNAVGQLTKLTLNSYTENGNAGAYTGTYYALAGVEPVGWTDDKVKAFSANPWRIFETRQRRLWFEPPPTLGTSGSVDYTNIDDASAASATTTVTASSATTNIDDASVANAAPVVTASSATTNADDISNAVVGSEVSGTVAVTNADDTSAATASPGISASSSTTNADDVSSAAAVPVVSASAASTNADDISDASAAVGSEIVGSVAYTNIDDASSATLKATVTASVAATNSDDISSAFSGAVVDGSIAVTNADDVSAADASPVVSGSSDTTNADDVSSAEAVAEAGEIIASVDVVNADDSSSAVAAPVITTSIAYSNLHDFSAAIAEINFGTIVEALLTTGVVQDTRIKKPGIPSDAPEWQRTMFEIFTGRRGNKITVAPHQTLSFSAIPTKEECEALYNYVSEVRQSIDQLTKRFDS